MQGEQQHYVPRFLLKNFTHGKKPKVFDSRSDALRFRNYIKSIQTMRTKIGSGANLAVKDIDLMLAEIAGFTALLQQIKLAPHKPRKREIKPKQRRTKRSNTNLSIFAKNRAENFFSFYKRQLIVFIEKFKSASIIDAFSENRAFSDRKY